MRKFSFKALVAGLCGALLSSAVAADVASDRAGAILVFPKVVSTRLNVAASVDQGADIVTDTIIQLSNTSNQPVRLKCFYIDATDRCSISGYACDPLSDSPCPDSRDVCLPRWVETDFRIFVTPQQPLAWRASHGLTAQDIPLDGRIRGIGGADNVGTRVPPVPFLNHPLIEEDHVLAADVFRGELKCIVVDAQDRGLPNNVIKGEATIVSALTTQFGGDAGSCSALTTGSDEAFAQQLFQTEAFQFHTVEKYNGIGIQAIEGDANGDKVLELGGPGNEYNGCPNILIVDHFFDFAVNPAVEQPFFAPITSDLTLVPCAQDLLRQEGGKTTVQYLVHNEFEQRFSTSTPIECFFERQLSRIDTRDPTRSIFSVYVAGTLTGQTRVRGVQGGLLGVLREQHGFGEFAILIENDGDLRIEGNLPVNRAAVNLHQQGVRSEADRIVIP